MLEPSFVHSVPEPVGHAKQMGLALGIPLLSAHFSLVQSGVGRVGKTRVLDFLGVCMCE